MGRARSTGLASIGQVFLGPAAYHANKGMFAGYPGVFFLMGIHPCDGQECTGATLKAMREAFAEDPRLRAVGEIGLDFYWKDCPPFIQEEAFRVQLALAKETDRPVVIHSRDAAKDTLLYYPAAHNKDSGVYTLPTAALNIAERAFYTNPSSTKIKSTVKEVYLHANVRTIGAEAFAECDSLTKVVFVASERPAGTMVIGRRAFADCSKLAELVFEESGTMTRVTETTEQGEKVSFKFEYTKSCGVAQIGEEAFESCSLQSLLLPSTLTAIGKNAFADNSKLNDIDLSHVRSDLQFGEYVFRNCRMLESVEIPDNVGYIPFNSVFYNCTKLKTFVVSPDNPNYYADEQGVLYNADVTEIAYYPEGLTGDYVIPNTIKSIGGGVFIGKTNIVKILSLIHI